MTVRGNIAHSMPPFWIVDCVMAQRQHASDLEHDVHGVHRSLMCRIGCILSSRGVRMSESRCACHIPHAIAARHEAIQDHGSYPC